MHKLLKFLVGSLIAITFVCVNFVNIKHGPTYTCVSSMETFTSRFSSYGIPFPYLQRSVHGGCIGLYSSADFGHKFIVGYLLLDILVGVILVIVTSKLYTKFVAQEHLKPAVETLHKD